MIELINVTKSFYSVNVLEEASFSFEKGSRTAVIGSSGSGKTTLLNLISGLLPVDKGMIKINGKVTDTPDGGLHPSCRNLGFAFQFPTLWPHLNVKSNILYGLSGLDKKEKQLRYSNILEAFEISDIAEKYPGEISGGQAKRVSLARTMIVKPQYLLLDEPLNNLDKELKEKVLKLIRELVIEANITLIYVTHDLQETKNICDYSCCIEDKKIKYIRS